MSDADGSLTQAEKELKKMEKVIYVMFCAIWYHLCNLKNVKNTYGGVLRSVKLQAFTLLY